MYPTILVAVRIGRGMHWQGDEQESVLHTSTVTARVHMCARVQELKKQVVKVPARSTTRAEMAAVEREIVDLQQQGAELGVTVHCRKASIFALC